MSAFVSKLIVPLLPKIMKKRSLSGILFAEIYDVVIWSVPETRREIAKVVSHCSSFSKVTMSFSK